MDYYRGDTRGGGGVELFKIILFIGAGFLACALVWSLTQYQALEQEAAIDKTNYENQLIEANARITGAEQKINDLMQTVNERTTERDAQARRAAAAEAALKAEQDKNAQLELENQTLNHALMEERSQQGQVVAGVETSATKAPVERPKVLMSGLIPGSEEAQFSTEMILLAFVVWLIITAGIACAVLFYKQQYTIRVTADEMRWIYRRRLGLK